MTDKQNLEALLEKVEAGCMIQIQEFGAVLQGQGPSCFAAYANGSLDAAQALHKAVLGDRWIWDGDDRNNAVLKIYGEKFILRRDPVSVRSTSPARAWLIAIIKALIWENKQ